MNDTLITVENVSKIFCRSLKKSLWYGMHDLAKELVGGRREESRRLREDEFWALKDISFTLKRGDCLGLIGHNGAGKTTLLKLLNGLIKPDQGRIEIRGRVGALIALGAGFNPVLTGRENIYVNAAVLGLTRKETDAKFQAIVDFAELGEFIDTPVQSYSSGMSARLGFSIAIAVQPDILLIDEVLAVGDAGFRFKAYRAISDLLPNSAIILVSHSLPQVSKVATRAMLLAHGQNMVESSTLDRVFDAYQAQQQQIRTPNLIEAPELTLTHIAASDGLRHSSSPSPNDRSGTLEIARGTPLVLEFFFHNVSSASLLHAALDFVDNQENIVAQSFSIHQGPVFKVAEAQAFRLSFSLPGLPLRGGSYSINLRIYRAGQAAQESNTPICLYQNIIQLQVGAGGSTLGSAPVQLQANWQTQPLTNDRAPRSNLVQGSDATVPPT